MIDFWGVFNLQTRCQQQKSLCATADLRPRDFSWHEKEMLEGSLEIPSLLFQSFDFPATYDMRTGP